MLFFFSLIGIFDLSSIFLLSITGISTLLDVFLELFNLFSLDLSVISSSNDSICFSSDKLDSSNEEDPSSL